MEFQTRNVNIVICVLNHHGVLPSCKILSNLSNFILVLKVNDGWNVFAFYHVDANSNSCSHLSSIILAPSIKRAICYLNNRELIGTCHFSNIIGVLVFFLHCLNNVVQFWLKSVLI
jgi:hypothetical protein